MYQDLLGSTSSSKHHPHHPIQSHKAPGLDLQQTMRQYALLCSTGEDRMIHCNETVGVLDAADRQTLWMTLEMMSRSPV